MPTDASNTVPNEPGLPGSAAKAGPSGLQDPVADAVADDTDSSMPSIEQLPSCGEDWDITGSQADRT